MATEENSEFSSKPKGDAKLNDCSLNKMKVWLRDGAITNK